MIISFFEYSNPHRNIIRIMKPIKEVKEKYFLSKDITKHCKLNEILSKEGVTSYQEEKHIVEIHIVPIPLGVIDITDRRHNSFFRNS